MLGGLHADLLITVALVFFAHAATICRAKNDLSLVRLPEWKDTSACNLDCSFNIGLCTWRQMVTDAFDWTRHNGSAPTEMTGPSGDHVGDGHYIYIEATSVTYGDTARLISSECADTGPQCLQFWYHIYGSSETTGLNVYLLQSKVAKVVWKKRNDQGDLWHLAQVDLNTTVAFQIIFDGQRGSNDQSDVAIDDIILHRGQCSDSNVSGTAIPFKPDFNMSTPTVSSPTMAATENPIGNVTVPPNVQLSTTSDPEPTLSNITVSPSVGVSTTSGPEPTLSNITVPPSVGVSTTSDPEPTLSNITVPPSVGVSTTSDPEPTLSNITVPPSVSVSTTVATNRPVLSGTAQVPTLNVIVPSTMEPTVSVNMQNGTKATGQVEHPVCHLDCDFEQDFCQWRQMLTDVFDWERSNGSTPMLTTGPLSDGHYLHIEAKKASLGDTARLISTECTDTGPQCLTFWYHMYGSADTMVLNVYLLEDAWMTVVWRTRNNQGQMWHFAQVDLVSNETFQIIFEGCRGVDEESDVALDDIKLIHGVCQDLVKPATTLPETWSTTNVLNLPVTSSNESELRPLPTVGPQFMTTTERAPSNEAGPGSSPTAGLTAQTAQSNATSGPQVPTITEQTPSNETRPSPTAGLTVPTAQGNATARPQVLMLTKPAPSKTTLSPTAGLTVPTAQSNVTADPQVPTTTKPGPSNETVLGPLPRAGLIAPTVQSNATARPQVLIFTPSKIGPSPTVGQTASTVQSNVTADPLVQTTTEQMPSNETGPSHTAGLTAPTAQSNVTAGPQVLVTTASFNKVGPSLTTVLTVPTAKGDVTAVPAGQTTTKPATSNETTLLSTAGLTVPTAQGNVTARPQVLMMTGPTPTAGLTVPTAQSNVTIDPRVPTTAAQMSSETRPSPTVALTATTAQGNATTGPPGPSTTQPAPSNETGPGSLPTAGLTVQTVGGNASVGPQVPMTTAPSNKTILSPTAGLITSTAQGNVTVGPPGQTTTQPAPSNETGPSPTAGLTASSTQNNVTAGPQIPITTEQMSFNETKPSPTALLTTPTVKGNATAGPQVPMTTAPSNKTIPSPTVGQTAPIAQSNATADPQVPTATKKMLSYETRPSPTAGLTVTTAQGNATAAPPGLFTTQPAPSSETGSGSSPTAGLSVQGNATAGPQVPMPTIPSNKT